MITTNTYLLYEYRQSKLGQVNQRFSSLPSSTAMPVVKDLTVDENGNHIAKIALCHDSSGNPKNVKRIKFSKAYNIFGPSIFIDAARCIWVQSQKKASKKCHESKDCFRKSVQKCSNNIPWKGLTVCIPFVQG